MAVHPNGDIIIADYDNKWVSIFSSEGKFKVGKALRVRIKMRLTRYKFCSFLFSFNLGLILSMLSGQLQLPSHDASVYLYCVCVREHFVGT